MLKRIGVFSVLILFNTIWIFDSKAQSIDYGFDESLFDSAYHAIVVVHEIEDKCAFQHSVPEDYVESFRMSLALGREYLAEGLSEVFDARWEREVQQDAKLVSQFFPCKLLELVEGDYQLLRNLEDASDLARTFNGRIGTKYYPDPILNEEQNQSEEHRWLADALEKGKRCENVGGHAITNLEAYFAALKDQEIGPKWEDAVGFYSRHSRLDSGFDSPTCDALQVRAIQSAETRASVLLEDLKHR